MTKFRHRPYSLHIAKLRGDFPWKVGIKTSVYIKPVDNESTTFLVNKITKVPRVTK